MSISPEEIAHLAELAALRLDARERERLQRELGAIIDHVARVSAAGERGDPVTAVESSTALRADDPVPSDADVARSIAPAFAEGFFVVPRLEALGDDG